MGALSRDDRLGAALGCAALVAAALLSYAGAFSYPPVFDDSNVLGVKLGAMLEGPLHTRWLSYVTIALTTAAAGMNVELLRLQNVLLHAGVAIALFFFLRDLVGRHWRGGEWCRGNGPAFIGAAVFALHPVTVYGVAYLAQRSILMATLFSVLSLHALHHGVRSGRGRWLVASVGLYVLAVFSKEHAVMLPALALFVAAEGPRRVFLSWSLATFAAMALVGLVVVLQLRGVIGANYEPFLIEAVQRAPAEGDQLYLRSVVTQAGLFFRYLATWLFPFPELMAVDVRLQLEPSPFTPAAIAGSVAFLAYGAAAARFLLRPDSRPLLGLAMLAPWLLFLPEFAAVRGQEPFVLYRSYLWGIGLPILVAGAAWPLSTRAQAVLGLALCVALAVGMRERLATFSTPAALWDDAVRKLKDDRLPFADRAIANRGVALLAAGRPAEALRDLDRAIALNPLNANALSTRASLYVAAGNLERAEADFAEALRVRPVFPDVYAARCGVRIVARRPAAALEDCRKAIDQDPRLALAHINMGVLHAQAGDGRRAVASFDRALAIEPESAHARHNRELVRRWLAAAR